MELFNPTKLKINFVKTYKFFVPFSLTIFGICLFLMFVKPGIKYGIDFRGGVEVNIDFRDSNVTAAQIRSALDAQVPGLSIVETDKPSRPGFAKEYIVTGALESKDDVSKKLEEGLTKIGVKDQDWTISKIDSVGPKVGGELRKAAFWSLIYTALLITMYLYLRFDIRYSPGAMLGVLHDLVFTCGFLILIGTEFSTNVVAALLTLAGYSINDTVVVFDRIREIEKTAIGKSKQAVVDLAINSTLSRTFIMGVTTLISIIILFIWGGPTLRDFSITLFIGVLVGTYSSIFVAAPMYLWGDKLVNKGLGTSSDKKSSGKMKPAKA